MSPLVKVRAFFADSITAHVSNEKNSLFTTPIIPAHCLFALRVIFSLFSLATLIISWSEEGRIHWFFFFTNLSFLMTWFYFTAVSVLYALREIANVTCFMDKTSSKFCRFMIVLCEISYSTGLTFEAIVTVVYFALLHKGPSFCGTRNFLSYSMHIAPIVFYLVDAVLNDGFFYLSQCIFPLLMGVLYYIHILLGSLILVDDRSPRDGVGRPFFPYRFLDIHRNRSCALYYCMILFFGFMGYFIFMGLHLVRDRLRRMMK